MRKLSLAFVSVLLLLSPTPVSAQEKIVISLRLNLEVQQSSGYVIASRTNDAQMTYATPTANGLGEAPGKVLFKLEPVEGPTNAYRLFIDTNGDGDLRDETPQTSVPNTLTVIKVKRKWANGRQLVLPYSIKHSRAPNLRNELRQDFLWMPHYRAEGRLQVGKCETLFTVNDLTSDAQFNDADLSAGTIIGLDRNGDGRIRGKGEYLMGNQIIEYCGERFLVDVLAADGTSISLVRTALHVPNIGEELPEFSLTTLDGQTIESKSLRNKIYLLDFWASWCKPCVEKFGLVKQIADEFKADVSVIAINVDEESLLPNAREIIKTYGLTWPHVMSGRGEADPLWKMFGGMEGNRLPIPLYVIVDAEGRLRYAANGGEDLSELRTVIRSLLK